MTLDRIHVDTIARLASAIAKGVDDEDNEDVTRRVWAEFLDPLRADGRVVLEPLDEQALHAVPTEEAVLFDRPSARNGSRNSAHTRRVTSSLSSSSTPLAIAEASRAIVST